jgi:hypothetical protein
MGDQVVWWVGVMCGEGGGGWCGMVEGGGAEALKLLVHPLVFYSLVCGGGLPANLLCGQARPGWSSFEPGHPAWDMGPKPRYLGPDLWDLRREPPFYPPSIPTLHSLHPTRLLLPQVLGGSAPPGPFCANSGTASLDALAVLANATGLIASNPRTGDGQQWVPFGMSLV